MKIISHRGNLRGPDPTKENTYDAINEALGAGFAVEVDVWGFNHLLYLGHDEPGRQVDFEVLYLWASLGDVYLHCKNAWAAQIVLQEADLEYKPIFPFMHARDQAVITRNKKLWVHPNAIHNVHDMYLDTCIAMVEECVDAEPYKDWYGICTDYPIEVKGSL